MTDDLAEEYPEAAPYIREAVEEHGEEWVIENYHPKISALGVLMSVPDVEELPFYDPERHESMSDEELAEMGEALGDYRSNLHAGADPGEE